MPRFRAILFDWDGTLFDSTRACYEVYQEILPRFGVPPFSFEEFRQSFIADYRKFYLKKGVPAARLPEVDDAWRQAFAEREDEISIFPFVQGLLTRLYNGDVRLALVSNGDGYRVRSELARHAIFDAFHCVVTKDEVAEFKPSPEGVRYALCALGVEPASALYVGDMAEDILAGKKAGVRTAGVLTGLHDRRRLEKEKPDFILNDASEVLLLL
ncbi:MAG: HAD family hydrolase [Candidatus Micrarchaeia archaeon]